MKLSLILLTIFSFNYALAQWGEEREGIVTYRSAQNIYVKFDKTEGIEVNDTLYLQNKTPAVLVKFISSRSVAGDIINAVNVKIGDKMIAYITISDSTKEEEEIKNEVAPKNESEMPDVRTIKNNSTIGARGRKTYNGRLSINSYSNSSSLGGRGDYQRWRYSLSFSATNIKETGITFNSYMIFSYRGDEWNKVTEDLGRYWKVYELGIKYEIDKKNKLWLGRNINRRVSNLGTSDGIQFEHSFSNYSAGIIAGSRPDINNMGLNAKLFQAGAYISRGDTLEGKNIEGSAGIFQQTNDFKTDRRFIYLQHSNNLINNISFFLSTEVDLYEKISGDEKNNLSLTSIFLSIRYNPIKIISLSATYDARKNIIYYETNKSFIDSLFENETRQGVRLSANVRPLNNLVFGMSGGYRHQKGDKRSSSNYTIFANYSKFPVFNSNINFNLTSLKTGYLNGTTYGIRLNKDFEDPSIGVAAGFRKVIYKFERGGGEMVSDEITGELNFRINREISINVFYEGSYQKDINFGRLVLGVTGRI
jgi:hypothetical protein